MAGSPSRSGRLLLFPGMGADARMYEPLRAWFPDLVVPPWLPPHPGCSLGDYARSYLERGLVTAHDWLGGSSFGGMLAIEIARQLRPRGVILIASCRHPRSIRPVLRAMAPLSGLVPLRTLHLPLALDRVVWSMMGLGGRSERAVFTAMLRDSPASFLRWCCRALVGWAGVDDPPCPVLHLHGADDRIIPSHRVAADHLVAGAGHAVTMTHAGALAGPLRAWLAGTPSPAAEPAP